MNGATALIYARSRHGNNGQGSDFARSRRQQQIIVALRSQIETIGGFGKLPDVINALGDNVLTDLTIGDAESLYSLVNGVNPATIEHISIDDTNFLYDCGYPTELRQLLPVHRRQELRVAPALRPGHLPDAGGARRGRAGDVRERERAQQQRDHPLGITHEHGWTSRPRRAAARQPRWRPR